jgi:hypothetical protein
MRDLCPKSLTRREIIFLSCVDSGFVREGKKDSDDLEDYVKGFREAGLRNIQGQVIPNRDHFAPESKPEEVLAALQRLLKVWVNRSVVSIDSQLTLRHDPARGEMFIDLTQHPAPFGAEGS